MRDPAEAVKKLEVMVDVVAKLAVCALAEAYPPERLPALFEDIRAVVRKQGVNTASALDLTDRFEESTINLSVALETPTRSVQ